MDWSDEGGVTKWGPEAAGGGQGDVLLEAALVEAGGQTASPKQSSLLWYNSQSQPFVQK